MTRSRHTDPRRVRAARRVRAPYARRGAGDPRRTRRLTATLELGGLLPSVEPAPRGTVEAPLPRVYARRPRAGYAHPASKAEVIALLRFFGEPYTYGLRAVELVPGPPGGVAGRQPLGRLRVPGTVR